MVPVLKFKLGAATPSSYEKISYPWAAAQVSGFKAYLTNAIYIYSPDQRTCGRPPSNASSTGGKSKSRRKLKSKPKLPMGLQL